MKDLVGLTFSQAFLLGIRSAWKEGLQWSVADIVFGETLDMPGEFFRLPNKDTSHSSEFIQLRQHISKIMPTPASKHGKVR